MNEIVELLRLPSPAPKPQALAFDGERLWMGSIETSRLYAIDPQQWKVWEESAVPGKPWGMTAVGDELRVICGVTAEDDRVIRRFVPGHGFKDREAIACPDNTGSHLSYDGTHLYVSQWYNRRILELDERGAPVREVASPHQICGHTFVDGVFYVISTEDEKTTDYWLTRIDPRGGTAAAEDLARVPFRARALAFDGERFWTNHREQNETVAFTLP
ncbi:MAG TPA: hypothetical protein VNJ51_15490 [Candidatus Dormibacteraeota bacterium]|nr:hypothetical protein [Candidatus Dormibacteraeota bacterium]